MKCAAEKPRQRCTTAGRDTEALCGPGLVSPPSAWGNLWACRWRNTLWRGGLCVRHGGRAARGSADTRLQWVSPCISVTIYTFVLLNLWFTKKNDNGAVCVDENRSPRFVVQAALHEVQSSLWQTGVTAPELDLPLLDVSVLLPAELWNERAVGTQPRKGKHKYTNYNSRKDTELIFVILGSVVGYGLSQRMEPSHLLCSHYKRQNSDRPNVSFRPNTLSFQDFWSFRKDNINWKKQTRIMLLMSCAVRPLTHMLYFLNKQNDPN